MCPKNQRKLECENGGCRAASVWGVRGRVQQVRVVERPMACYGAQVMS